MFDYHQLLTTMKLADANSFIKQPLKVQQDKTLITLVIDPGEEEILSEHTTQFTLRSCPRDADSAKYALCSTRAS